MANETFQLKTVRRMFDEGVELSEALGLPEVTALGDSETRGRKTLAAKAKDMLEEEALCPTISLHRRRLTAELELDSLPLTFEPPRRSPDWEKEVQLLIHFVRWAEGETHHAFVPGLNVHVFASRAALLPERVEQHIRLLLAGRGRRLTLRRLGQLARVQELRLGQLDVVVQRKTPKQLAQADQLTEQKKSVLATLGEELPPYGPRLDGTIPSPSARAGASGLSAFEMEMEVAQLAELLAGPHRRSVLLVGRPGTGKTALVHELARRRAEFGFSATPFWSTNGARLMTGPIGFGMWQERCQQLCREVTKLQAVLHLNHLTELLEVGKAARGEQSTGSFLRPWIARGEVLAIAECTPEQVTLLERDEPHLLGAFQQLSLAPRTPEQTRSILTQVLAQAPGTATTVTVSTQNALERLHALHQRYATYSANPGRPLRFLKNLLADQFPEKNLQESQVIAAFSRETGLPPALLDDEVPLPLDATGQWFAQRVIGQPEAVARVVDLLVLIKARLARPHKPLASLLFIGPTGTGKTEMAKALAEFLFGDPARLVRFDLNEFSDPVAIQRLIGGPTTCEAEGLLTARVREQPFSVILLDEFEKADPRFFDLLLQILGDGRLTDAAGRVADFCNSVLVMTSNLGAQAFQRGMAGFRAEGAVLPEAQAHFSEAVRQFLRPEIYNRLDAIVPFRTLPLEEVRAVARRHLELLCQRDGIRLRAMQLTLEPPVAELLAELGFVPRYGARPLKRAIERELLVHLAEALNQYQPDTPLEVKIGTAGGKVRVEARAQSDEHGRLRQEASEQLAEKVMNQRRLITRLERGRAATKLGDELVMLESLERRVTGKRPNPLVQARLTMLHSLRECLRAVTALATRARQLETEALAYVYRREVPEEALVLAELEALEAERTVLMRQVFRRQHEQPDDVVLVCYSEHRDTLFEFASAYRTVGAELGELVALDCFLPPPGGRSSTSKLVRETPKKVDDFFRSPPEKIIAVALHLRGPLFFPRFHPEAGRHVMKVKKKEYLCLVETAGLPFASYEPPAGIERQGALQSRGAPLRRTYDTEDSVLHDEDLGERAWPGLDLPLCLKDLSEQRLTQTIETATN